MSEGDSFFHISYVVGFNILIRQKKETGKRWIFFFFHIFYECKGFQHTNKTKKNKIDLVCGLVCVFREGGGKYMVLYKVLK